MEQPAADELIRLYDLSKTFRVKGNTITALENINLSIAPGEIFGIIGMSGDRKSVV